MPELSIIVPIYRVEKHLKCCIDSILSQTYKDFELILVDDGSPDKCGEICDSYAMKDSRLIVIHQDNLGVSAARNSGLKIASGKYITFVDSDDMINPEMYKAMIDIIKEKGVDVVICGLQYVDSSGNIVIDVGMQDAQNRIIQKDQLLNLTLGLRQKLFHGSLCNKVIKREKIIGKSFNNNISLFEDWLGLLSFYDTCNTAWIIPEPFYYYRADSENSLGATTSSHKILISMKELYQIIPKYKSNKELYRLVQIRFLEDSKIFMERMEPSLTASLKLKRMMLSVILYGYLKKILSRQLFHKYLIEGIIRS